MNESNDGVSFDEIVEYCNEVLFAELGRPINTLELSLLVCKLLPELNPVLEAWPVITRAVSLSANSAALFLSDPSEEDFAKTADLPGYSALDLFVSTPEEMLGTFDQETGYLLGHMCVVIWEKISDRYYFLDPAQGLLESDDDEIRFDRLAMTPVQGAQNEVTIAFDNGVTAMYWLYPEIAIPKMPAETIPIIDRCVVKVRDMLVKSDESTQLLPGPGLH